MLQNLGFSNADKEKVSTLLAFFLLPIYLINSHKTLLRASVFTRGTFHQRHSIQASVRRAVF